MPAPEDGRGAAQARTAIEAALGQIGFTLPGSITIRHARCGKPRCACAADPPALHGPYIQWTRTVNGKTVTRTLTPAQYQAYAPWFANARRLRALTAELQALSLQEMARAEGWAKITPGTPAPPGPAPSAARTRTTPNHPKRREISPLTPGTALRRTPVTAGHYSSVVSPRPFRTCLANFGPCAHDSLLRVVGQLQVEARVDLGLVFGSRVAECLHESGDGADGGADLLFGHPGRRRAGAAGRGAQAGVGGQLAGLGLGDPLADDGRVCSGVERRPVLD